VRINASLTDGLLKKIDEAASEQNKSRSRFIREAAEKYIAEHERTKEAEKRKEAFAQAIRLQDKLRKKGGKWDAVGEIRKWREKAR
jgi:metal-responsive CopG/Arc/MetJ family transcriptional regulator